MAAVGAPGFGTSAGCGWGASRFAGSGRRGAIWKRPPARARGASTSRAGLAASRTSAATRPVRPNGTGRYFFFIRSETTASTFFHSAPRAWALGAEAMAAIAREDSSSCCLALRVTTT